MKIILGKNPDLHFQLLDDDGVDITELLHVTKIIVVAEARQQTRAILHLENIEAEVEVADDLIEKRKD